MNTLSTTLFVLYLVVNICLVFSNERLAISKLYFYILIIS